MNAKNLFRTAATKFMPRTDTIIFESNPDYADNTYWFFKYLAEKTDVFNRYEPIWIIKDRKNIRSELCGKRIKCILKTPETKQETRDYVKALYLSKFIIDCNSYVHKRHKDQVRVFLGHGMPLKIVKSYDLKKGEVDLNTITTYNFNKHFYDIGDTDENMRNFGYCRTDILHEHAGKRKNRDKTYIIWMPTYRQHQKGGDLTIDNSFPLGLPVIKTHGEMTQVNECLKENNTVLYLRPHPVQDTGVLHLEEMSNIIIADNGYLDKRNLQLYEFLTETDALITDYSSVYYDYLMLERPIALAVEDLEQFSAKWPMYFDNFKANYKCPYLETVDDLKRFITDTANDNDRFESERLEAKSRFYDYTDGKTCERIYNFLAKEYGF